MGIEYFWKKRRKKGEEIRAKKFIRSESKENIRELV